MSGGSVALLVIFGLIVAALVFLVVYLKFINTNKDHKAANYAALFVATLIAFDFLSDVNFVLQVFAEYGMNITVQLCLASLGVTFLANFCIVIYILSGCFKDAEFSEWAQESYKALGAVVVLSCTGTAALGILSSQVYKLKALSAPFPNDFKQKIVYMGLAGTLLEDFPQLILQIVFASRNGVNSAVAISGITSFLMFFGGLLQKIFLLVAIKSSNTHNTQHTTHNTQHTTHNGAAEGAPRLLGAI